MEASKRKIIVLSITIIILATFLGYNIANQFEATALVQCGDDLKNGVFPIDVGEKYTEGYIKFTSYSQNVANIYEPYIITHNKYPEPDTYEKFGSFAGWDRNKCVIEVISDWRFR